MLKSKSTKSAKPTSASADYHALTEELHALTAKLESGDLDIDEAVTSYERGLEIVAQLETRLARAENKVTELRAKLDQEANE